MSSLKILNNILVVRGCHNPSPFFQACKVSEYIEGVEHDNDKNSHTEEIDKAEVPVQGGSVQQADDWPAEGSYIHSYAHESKNLEENNALTSLIVIS